MYVNIQTVLQVINSKYTNTQEWYNAVCTH